MYRNSILFVAIKLSMSIFLCISANSALAKGISLKAHQLKNTKEAEITVVCLGKRQITSLWRTMNKPLTTKEEYDIEMISFKAKGKFTGFTFTGRAEDYSDEKVKKKLLSRYDVTLTIDAKTGALKRLEFDGINHESRGDKYSNWDVLIEGPMPASEDYYNYNSLSYGDIKNDVHRIKKFHGSHNNVSKDSSGNTDYIYKWTFDHIAKKLSDLNLSKPNRALSTDTWISVSVDVNAEPKVEIEVVQPFTLPQKEKSIIPGNITAKCENLGSEFNSYWLLFYAKSPLGCVVDNSSSLMGSNLVIDDFEKVGFTQKDWRPILDELKISEHDIINLGVFNHDGTYTYNYFRYPGIMAERVGDQLKKTAPLDITVGVAMIKVSDKKLKSSATAKLTFSGIVRLDEVTLHGPKEEIRNLTEKVNVFRDGLGMVAVYGKGIKNRPSRSRQVPVYLNTDDIVNLDRNGMVKITCPTGLRLSIMSKRAVVDKKKQTAKFIIGATRGQHGYQYESNRFRNCKKEIGIGLSGAGIIAYSNPYISVPVAIIAIGIALLPDVPFVVSEIQSTILAEFNEKGIDFYTIEGTNLLRTAKGDVSEVTTGQKSVFTSDGRITEAETFDKSQLKPEALELLEFHQKPDEVTSNETLVTDVNLVETAKETPPLSSSPKETSQSDNTVMTETKTTTTEPIVVDDVTKGKYEKVFCDDFNEENKGKGQLNYRGFEQWYITHGEVDLIGNSFWDIQPENGLYVDLDGSINKAGTIQTRMAYSLPPGKYRLQFDIAGHQWSTNTVVVSVGDVYRETFTLNPKEPFRTIRRDISVEHFTQARIRFEHKGGDNAGILLDNVRLDQEI